MTIPRPRVLDVLLVAWTALCIGLGIWVGAEVRNLTGLTDTVGSGGRALHQTAAALGELKAIPIVGPRLESMQVSIHATSLEAKASAQSGRSTIENLSILLAVAIALVPTVPVIAVYLLQRARSV